MAKKFRYVPILRWKRGERSALQMLDDNTREGVAPLIVISSDAYGDTREPRPALKRAPKTPPPPAAEELASQIARAWGSTPIMLDASALSGSPKLHHLDYIADAASDAGLMIVPATSLLAPPEYVKALERFSLIYGGGIALRVSFDDLAHSATWGKSWPFPLEETDLIIDFAEGIRSVAPIVSAVPAIFAKLHAGTKWRSVTMAGGSIPQTLTGFAVGTTLIPRHEALLWNTLQKAGLPYSLDFGDYATVTPNPLNIGVAFGFPINAKYTLRREFLIRHGVRTGGATGVKQGDQFFGHAKAIVAHVGRDPLTHCWGDNHVDAIAIRAAPPGNPEGWIKIGVNRHIETTRFRLP